jgi:hypothetical protein
MAIPLRPDNILPPYARGLRHKAGDIAAPESQIRPIP